MYIEEKVTPDRNLSIGVIITSVLDSYQNMILTGIEKQAKSLNIRLVCFNAGMFDYSEFSAKSKLDIVKLIDASYIDGLIILPGILLWENGQDDLQKILLHCNKIPIVSIGIPLENIPSIVVDNYIGMCGLFEHLIESHNCNRIAFVRGPVTNPEAEERYKAYVDTLSKFNIPYNEELVFIGDFESWAGPAAVKHFCDTQKLKFDALVCSDDVNAIQAMVELEKRNYKIPEDIKIGGFDDIEMSSISSPPLTTVNQPLIELGSIGIQRISEHLSGVTLPLIERVPTHLVIRNSCSCSISESFLEKINDKIELPPITDEIDNEFKIIFPFSWEDKIKEDLLKDILILYEEINRILINGQNELKLKKLLSSLIDKFIGRGVTTRLWHSILEKIFLRISQIKTDDKIQCGIKYLWKSTILMLNTNENDINSNKQIKSDARSLTIQVTGHRLSSSFSFDEIWKTLSLQLPLSDINFCSIILSNKKNLSDNQSYCYNNGETTIESNINLRRKNIIEDDLLKRTDTYQIIVPLITGHGHDGYIYFYLDEINSKFEIIAEQISSAFRTALLLEKINIQNNALQESEAENTRIILDSIGDAVIAVDIEGKVTKVNRVAEKLFGYTSKEFKNRNLFTVIKTQNSNNHKRLANTFQSIVEQGIPGDTIEEIIKTEDGLFHNIDYNGAPIRDINDSVVGVVLVMRDMTEQTFLQDQLNQTRKMDSLGQLASGIAHDLNNMLAGISGNAQMIKIRLEKPEKIISSADTILQITEVASELMRNLLSFSHKSKITSAPVDIHDCIKNSKNILEHSIDKMITVVEDLSASSHTVRGEAALIQNIIINLCINARDAMPDGGTLTISTKDITLNNRDCETSQFEIIPGSYCALAISDTGIGMEKELVDKIFEPFFTTKTIGKGTGLGLSAVYGIVKSHKGSIKIESEPGKGTSFIIYFPTDSEVLYFLD